MSTKAASRQLILIDVIVPVHNSTKTVIECVSSALLNQRFPNASDQLWCERTAISSTTASKNVQSDGGSKSEEYYNFDIDIAVCCHDDGSTDDSLQLLTQLQRQLQAFHEETSDGTRSNVHEGKIVARPLRSQLLVSTGNASRGAAHARNVAAGLRRNHESRGGDFLCFLDSDDVMRPTRIVEQAAYLRALPETERYRTLLGCQFIRDPPESTWHYARWANTISDERLMLERFREVTVLQPTWMISRRRFEIIGGYVELELPCNTISMCSSELECRLKSQRKKCKGDFGAVYELVCDDETLQSIRLAEDLRFFHAHLRYSDRKRRSTDNSASELGDGIVKLLRAASVHQDVKCQLYGQLQSESWPIFPLVLYRHQSGLGQSSQTPRKLLLKLRLRAFEDSVLKHNPLWQKGFAIWGAGRDAKDVIKEMYPPLRLLVKCLADVDKKKIDSRFYVNRQLGVKIPIVHFTALSRHVSQNVLSQGSIERTEIECNNEYSNLPVMVCVAMYRTNGMLEENVMSIGRKEGMDLWHFS